jgi:hypothetical protein
MEIAEVRKVFARNISVIKMIVRYGQPLGSAPDLYRDYLWTLGSDC